MRVDDGQSDRPADLYDAMIAAVADPAGQAGQIADLAARIIADYPGRVERSTRRPRQGPIAQRTLLRAARVIPRLLSGTAPLIALFFALIVLATLVAGLGDLGIVWFLLIIMLIAAYSDWSRARHSRHRRRVATGHCPRCDYDLQGLPGAIEPALIGDLTLGPRRCPECAQDWPLAPALTHAAASVPVESG